ncbi:putative transcription factor C2H2 family [Lupinus albus]|uniref:Putative transcription factor C2H2 family n=1 Tax=Lupinus albus TaxID=3870 RepID=A0A6A4NU55_LUPAL|nr:putative transcription factor C2H2 family [Lupinus albus]
MFIKDRPETVIIDMRERNIFYGQTPQNNQRVVRIFDKLLLVIQEKGGGNGRRQGSVKKVIGSVVCYGSQAITVSGGSDCVICLEDFKEGEECLVFTICGHLFHLICIHYWLENKPTCPICRQCIPSTQKLEP